MDIRFYLTLFLRRFHYFLIVFVLCTTAGLYVARTLPTTYQAEARLLVEQEQIPDELAASTVQIDPGAQLEVIQQRIMTRDTLIDLANRLNIYEQERRSGERPMRADEIVQDLRTRIRIQVTGSQRRGAQQATVVRVSFSAPTGPLAANVTNEMVNLVLAEDVTMRTRSARQTLDFFEQKVIDLDRQLSDSSAQILSFQEANITALPDSLDFRRNQQATAQERLLQIERQIAELQDRRDRITEIFESIRNGNTLGLPDAAQTPEMQRLQSLKDQRSELMSVLSPDNPRVRMLNRQIEGLETVVADQTQLTSETQEANGSQLSPFELQLIDLNGQIEFLSEQRDQIQDEIAALGASIATTPGNAVTLAALERNHEGIVRQYNEAIAARAKAQTGDTIEGLSRGQRISIIETAVAPSEPNSPNRRKIAMAGAGAGLMAGVALVALLELLRRGIRRPVDLTQGLGITTFATLPYMRSRRELRRRRLFVWGGVIGILASALAAAWAVDTFYLPLDQVIEKIQQRLR